MREIVGGVRMRVTLQTSDYPPEVRDQRSSEDVSLTMPVPKRGFSCGGWHPSVSMHSASHAASSATTCEVNSSVSVLATVRRDER